MCGIAGHIAKENTVPETGLVKNMCLNMIHRGPDAQQTEEKDQICFGHARLSIIDLNEKANQPMWNKNKTLLLVLNGEIYNYLSLKKQLTDYEYKTKSDTEVVLAAYEKWGIDFVNHLEGMFAIALYDAANQTTLLVRDRFGKKPLYYFENESGFWFASEIRALLSTDKTARKINRSALGYYLQFQTVHFPETMIEGVYMLPPGNVLHIKNQEKQCFPYFLEEQAQTGKHPYEKAKLKKLFYESVQKRLVSDVPLAVLLSAGIDSNLILSAASQHQSIDAFTIGFDDKSFDESELAALSAKQYQAKHHIIKLSEADYLSEVKASLTAQDHPSGDGANTFLISKYIKQAGFTVALSGLGGDEVFYGYPHYAMYEKLSSSLLFKAVPSFSIALGNNIVKNNKLAKLNSLKKSIDNPAQSIAAMRSNFDHAFLNQWFGLAFSSYENCVLENNALNVVSKTETTHYMHDVLLRDADQMSMAHSLELRNPFLDHSLVQYVWGIENKTARPAKNLLLDALGDELPTYILNKKKTGFTFPWDKWMKGDLKTFCESQMLYLENTGLFKPQSIQKAWEAYLQGSKIFTWSRVWPLISLAHWIKENGIK